MQYTTTFYDRKGTTLLFKEIDGILPITLQPDMKIIIDDAEVRVAHWQYLFKPTAGTFELRIFLRGRWPAVTPLPLPVDPQMA
jgi:hypothetical protein